MLQTLIFEVWLTAVVVLIDFRTFSRVSLNISISSKNMEFLVFSYVFGFCEGIRAFQKLIEVVLMVHLSTNICNESPRKER